MGTFLFSLGILILIIFLTIIEINCFVSDSKIAKIIASIFLIIIAIAMIVIGLNIGIDI